MSDPSISSDDLAEFRAAFFEECGDMLVSIDAQLAGADSSLPSVPALNDVFRAVHTIKGAAGFFNLEAVGKFAHAFEALLGAAREGRIDDKERLGRLLVSGADVLATLIDRSRDGMTPPPDLGRDVANRIEDLLRASDARQMGAAAPSPEAAEPDTDRPLRHLILSVRLLTASSDGRDLHGPLLSELGRLGTLTMRQEQGSPAPSQATWVAELVTRHDDDAIRRVFAFVEHELVIENLVAHEQPCEAANAGPQSEERSTKADTAPGKGKAAVTTIRVDLARIDRLVNMVGELVITQAMLTQQISDQSGGNRQQLRQGHEDLANYTRELQECVMAIRMQPVRSVFARIPRLVREISSKLGKKVRLEMSGEQTEIDKTVIEELADPLLHMIRNAIDHGIESIEKRRAAGKPDEGLIELSASQRGGNILITLTDDGAGIDRTKVRAKAIERGVIAPDASLSGEEIDQLIFAPGFSTAEQVTDVSGRGVGMDVVLSNISNLGGRIHIQSTFGRGTKFTLVLPLTLSVLDGMLVSVSEETYILPLTNIVETIRPERHAVRHLANGANVVAIRGEFIRLIALSELFNLRGATAEPWKALVVVVELDNGSKIGLVVDELLGQRQVVVKSLQENFDPVQGVSGATILGTGKVALILDIEQISRLGARHLESDFRTNRALPQNLEGYAA